MAENEEKKGLEHAQTPVGQYYLLDKIAQGGMAEIFKGLAYDLHGIKKTVVIKKILPSIASDPEFIQMLVNEAKIAVMLSHGNIAQIYDLGKVGDDYFMVMEFVDGKSLSQIHKRCLKNGMLIPVDHICHFVTEVANGLNYMHRRSADTGRNLGIIHRDISPQNIIVSYSGTVKIIDFGIAKAAVQLNITDSGVLKGKFAYMSPEQAKGEPVDHRTDIFSLGVILYELLTGKRLFKGKDKRETLQNVRRAYVPAPSSVRPEIPQELDKIVMKALAKNPQNRYTWASELRGDLTKFLHQKYPEFQESSLTEFIRDIFKDDIAEQEELDEEAKTPHLIIDHTQSAILPEFLEKTDMTRIPPQLKEFMLDDETPFEKIEELPSEAEEEEETKKKFDFKKFINEKRNIFFNTLIAISILVGISFVVKGFYEGTIKLPFIAKTKLIVDVAPPDAMVVINKDELLGISPFTIKNLKSGQKHTITVSKEGYLSESKEVTLQEGDKKKLEIILKAAPLHLAKIEINSSPEGATIFLNDKDTNRKTPATITSLKPEQSYKVGLYLKDYKYWIEKITLKPDEEKDIEAKLTMNFGSVKIISSPSGASVSIDSKDAGKTPLNVTDLEPGRIIEIAVSIEGYETWSGKFRIKAGTPIVLHPNLERTKAQKRPKFIRKLEEEKQQLIQQREQQLEEQRLQMLDPAEY